MDQEPRPLEWTDELVARFWAYYARRPEMYFSTVFGADVVARTRRYLAPGARVWDCGCGPGFLIPALLDAGLHVTGADFETSATNDAAQRFAGHSRFEGIKSIRDLVLADDRFDALYLLEVVEHLTDYHLEQTLTNARDLLKVGGLLIVTTPNKEILADNLVYCPLSNKTFHRWQHVRSWSAETITAAFRDEGNEIILCHACNFKPAGNNIGLKSRLSSMLARFRRREHLFVIARSR